MIVVSDVSKFLTFGSAPANSKASITSTEAFRILWGQKNTEKGERRNKEKGERRKGKKDRERRKEKRIIIINSNVCTYLETLCLND